MMCRSRRVPFLPAAGLFAAGALVAANAGAILAAAGVAIVNRPARLPLDGVLVPGINDSTRGYQIAGEVLSVRAEGEAVAGSMGSWEVSLTAEANGPTQVIPFWRPDTALPQGTLSADIEGLNTSVGIITGSVSFVVVDELGPAGLSIDLDEQRLELEKVAETRVVCGSRMDPVSFDVSSQLLTTAYRQLPVLVTEFSLSALETTQSQYFSRQYDPATGAFPEFLPGAGTATFLTGGGILANYIHINRYEAALTDYCFQHEILSLQTGEVTSDALWCLKHDLGPLPDTIPATAEEIDTQLIGCNDPPPKYRERWCELMAEQGVLADCDGLVVDAGDDALSPDASDAGGGVHVAAGGGDAGGSDPTGHSSADVSSAGATSPAIEGGDAAAEGDAGRSVPNSAKSDGGCTCSVPTSRRQGRLAWCLALLAILGFRLRRRSSARFTEVRGAAPANTCA